MIEEYIEYGAYGYTNEYRTLVECNCCYCKMDVPGRQKAGWQYLTSLGWIQVDNNVFCPDCVPCDILYYVILDKDGNEKEKGATLVRREKCSEGVCYHFDRPINLEPGETLSIQYTSTKKCKFDHIVSND